MDFLIKIANFGKQFLCLVLICTAQCECAEDRIYSSNITLLFARISEELGSTNQVSLLQNANILFSFLLITSKPFDHLLVTMNLDLVAKTVVGFFITILFLIVFLPFYLILFVAKKVVEFIVLCPYGKGAVKSTGSDVMWGIGSKGCHPFITVAMKLDGYPDINMIKERINKRVLNFQTKDGRIPFLKFKQIFHHIYGYFFWKECDHFDIDNHIKLINLTKLYPNFHEIDSEYHYLDSTDHLLCHYTSDFGFQKLLADQPQWEINLLTREKENGFIIFFKLHHAIGDGMSLLRLLLEHIIDNPSKVSKLHPIRQHPIKKFFYYLWSLTFIPFAMKLLLLDKASNPLHGKKLSGKKVLVTSGPISLDLVKSIKGKTNTAVIDVLLSCLSYAVANHFHRKSFSVEKINMFFPIGVQDVNAPISLCNKFTVGVTTLLTQTDHEIQSALKETTREGVAIRRLFQIKNTLDKLRRGPAVFSMYCVASTIIAVLPVYLAKRFFNATGLTLSFSNIPGPQNEIYALGSKLTEMRFWVPDREPNGCGISIMSYNGQMRMGFSVDEALVESRKEVEMMVDDIGLQLAKLSQELNL